MLTRETFVGPWAGLPVAWTTADEFDEETYRSDVANCCRAGVPGVYSGGTTGEFYAMELAEFREVTRATVEEAHAHGAFAMIGCGSTYTRGASRRAEIAAQLGADAIQLPLPYWLEIPDDQIVPFFQTVSAACGGLPLSIYDTRRAKKCPTLDQHRAIKEVVPNYLMVKANPGTVGLTPDGCQVLSTFVNVFSDETEWSVLGPYGVAGACSWFFYWKPSVSLRLWRLLRQENWSQLMQEIAPVKKLIDYVVDVFEPKGLTDTALDRFGAVALGSLQCGLRSRGPYPSASERDVLQLLAWSRKNYPELLLPD